MKPIPTIKQKPPSRPPVGPDKRPRIPERLIRLKASRSPDLPQIKESGEEQTAAPEQAAVDSVTQKGKAAANRIVSKANAYGKQSAKNVTQKAVYRIKERRRKKQEGKSAWKEAPSSPATQPETPAEPSPIQQTPQKPIQQAAPQRPGPEPKGGAPQERPVSPVSPEKSAKSIRQKEAVQRNRPDYGGQSKSNIKEKSSAPSHPKPSVHSASKVSTQNPDIPTKSAKNSTMRRCRKLRQTQHSIRHEWKAAGGPVKSIKNAQKSIKSTQRTVKGAKAGIKTAERGIKTAAKTAKATAKASARALQAAKTAAKMAAQAAKAAVKATIAAVKAVIAAVKGLIEIIVAGGWVAVVAILLVALIAFLLASPFGIFSGGENGGETPNTAEVVQLLKEHLEKQVDEICEGTSYDELRRSGDVDWIGVLAVYAVREGLDADSRGGILVWDGSARTKLQSVYNDMVSISHRKSDDGDILYIAITCESPYLMPEEYRFTGEQTMLLSELLSPAFALSWADVLGINRPDYPGADVVLPDDLLPERRAVIEAALTLEGRVTYFWGGKSTVLGWDEEWGTMRKVTAEGNDTTGTWLPYGLDCSGFTAWAFINGAGDKRAGDALGYNTTGQWANTQPIPWNEAQPGDLLFLAPPGQERYNHVGIVVEKQGEDYLVAHCSSGRNGVAVTTARAAGFRYARRPNLYAVNS